MSRAIIEDRGFTNSRTVHAQTMRIIFFFAILHQNDAQILGTRRRSGPVPHLRSMLHASVLEWVSRADFGCILHHFSILIDLSRFQGPGASPHAIHAQSMRNPCATRIFAGPTKIGSDIIAENLLGVKGVILRRPRATKKIQTMRASSGSWSWRSPVFN